MFGGVRWTEVKIDLRSYNPAWPGGPNYSRYDKDWIDPVIGTKLRWTPRRWISMFGGVDVGLASGGDSSSRFEAGLAVHPTEWLGVELRYRHLKIRHSASDFWSPYEATTRGPLFGLSITF